MPDCLATSVAVSRQSVSSEQSDLNVLLAHVLFSLLVDAVSQESDGSSHNLLSNTVFQTEGANVG